MLNCHPAAHNTWNRNFERFFVLVFSIYMLQWLIFLSICKRKHNFVFRFLLLYYMPSGRMSYDLMISKWTDSSQMHANRMQFFSCIYWKPMSYARFSVVCRTTECVDVTYHIFLLKWEYAVKDNGRMEEEMLWMISKRLNCVNRIDKTADWSEICRKNSNWTLFIIRTSQSVFIEKWKRF